MTILAQRIICVGLSLILAVTPGLSDAQKKKSDLEKQKKNTQSMLAELRELKDNVNVYVQELDQSLVQLEEDIAHLEEQQNELSGRIALGEKELAGVQKESARQYEDMKLRIRYMYERGDAGWFELLTQSDSLTELLNRSEYVTKIGTYDREKMAEYEALQEEIRGRQAELKSRQEELDELRLDADGKREEIRKLLEDKYAEIAGYESRIDKAEGQLSEYDKAIREEEATIKAIEAEIKRKEEQARLEKKYNSIAIGDIAFVWPCPSSYRITSYFGTREAPTKGASTSHQGIDIGASQGESILAAADGEVSLATYSSSAGNYVMINHGGGIFTVYMHCSKLLVKEGEKVTRGQTIAKVGSTGYSTGPHLHFGIRYNGKYVDPLAYVKN